METLKFVGAQSLQKQQLLHVIQLLIEAENSGKTKIGSEFSDLITNSDKLQTIQPYIDYIHVLMNHGDVVGFFIATSQSMAQTVTSSMSVWCKNDPELADCLQFYINETAHTDLILYDIAVDAKYRGQGLFKVLHEHLRTLARDSNCNRIVFAVYQSNPAFSVYEHYGAQVLGEVVRTNAECQNKLMKCCFSLQ